MDTLLDNEREIAGLCKWYIEARSRAEAECRDEMLKLRLTSLKIMYDVRHDRIVYGGRSILSSGLSPVPLTRTTRLRDIVVAGKRPAEDVSVSPPPPKRSRSTPGGTCEKCSKVFRSNTGLKLHLEKEVCIQDYFKKKCADAMVRVFRFGEVCPHVSSVDIYIKTLFIVMKDVKTTKDSLTIENVWTLFKDNIEKINRLASASKNSFCFYFANENGPPPGISEEQSSQMSSNGIYKQHIDPGYSFDNKPPDKSDVSSITVREFLHEKGAAYSKTYLRALSAYCRDNLPKDDAERKLVSTRVFKRAAVYKRDYLEKYWELFLSLQKST